METIGILGEQSNSYSQRREKKGIALGNQRDLFPTYLVNATPPYALPITTTQSQRLTSDSTAPRGLQSLLPHLVISIQPAHRRFWRQEAGSDVDVEIGRGGGRCVRRNTS